MWRTGFPVEGITFPARIETFLSQSVTSKAPSQNHYTIKNTFAIKEKLGFIMCPLYLYLLSCSDLATSLLLSSLGGLSRVTECSPCANRRVQLNKPCTMSLRLVRQLCKPELLKYNAYIWTMHPRSSADLSRYDLPEQTGPRFLFRLHNQPNGNVWALASKAHLAYFLA